MEPFSAVAARHLLSLQKSLAHAKITTLTLAASLFLDRDPLKISSEELFLPQQNPNVPILLTSGCLKRNLALLNCSIIDEWKPFFVLSDAFKEHNVCPYSYQGSCVQINLNWPDHGKDFFQLLTAIRALQHPNRLLLKSKANIMAWPGSQNKRGKKNTDWAHSVEFSMELGAPGNLGFAGRTRRAEIILHKTISNCLKEAESKCF